MYSMIKDNAALRSKSVVKVETNRKGIVEVFNAIDTEDAVYITAPDPIEQGGNDRIFNSVKVKYSDGQVLFGGKSTIRIEGDYLI